MTQNYTETCNAHAGNSTNAQTGNVVLSTGKRNVSSEKSNISSGPSLKTAPKSSIPAATDCVRKAPAAATRSGAAALRQPAVGMSAQTLSYSLMFAPLVAVVHAVRTHLCAVVFLKSMSIKRCTAWSSSHSVVSYDTEQLTVNHSFVHSSV